MFSQVTKISVKNVRISLPVNILKCLRGAENSGMFTTNKNHSPKLQTTEFFLDSAYIGLTLRLSENGQTFVFPFLKRNVSFANVNYEMHFLLRYLNTI